MAATADGSGVRTVDVPAKLTERTSLDQAVLLFNEVIATLFILAAAWLVWTRPGGMTWGFFLYAIWPIIASCADRARRAGRRRER